MKKQTEKTGISRKYLRILAVVLALTMLAALCACGPAKNPDDTKTTPAPQENTKFTADDIYIKIGEIKLTAGERASDFVNNLKSAGIEYTNKEEAESCLFDGQDITYNYAFGRVFTFPEEGSGGSENLADEIYATGAEVTAKGGLKVGDTAEKVKETLGDGFFMDGESMMIYNASGDINRKTEEPMLYFYLENGTVTGIGVVANLYHIAA